MCSFPEPSRTSVWREVEKIVDLRSARSENGAPD